MSEFHDTIRFAIGCSVPVLIMGFAAWLMAKRVPGWWAYLIAAFLIAATTKVQVGA